jgi:hypothetical protein
MAIPTESVSLLSSVSLDVCTCAHALMVSLSLSASFTALARAVRGLSSELLAAIVCQVVAAFDIGLQRLRHDPQHLVFGLVAERVVEALEMIDVGEREAKRIARFRRFSRLDLKHLVEAPAVGDPGQAVGQGIGADHLQDVMPGSASLS